MTGQHSLTHSLPAYLQPPLFARDETQRHAEAEASLTLDTLLDWRGEHQGDRPFLCPLDLEAGTYHELSFSACAALVRLSAETLVEAGLAPRQENEHPVVVGVRGSNAVELWVNKMGVSRLGHIPFLISLTLSMSTVKQLLRRAEAKWILWDEASRSTLADGSVPILPWTSVDKRVTVTLETAKSDTALTTIDASTRNNDIAEILHTTGSTALPKLIPRRHNGLATTHEPLSKEAKLVVTFPHHAYANNTITSALVTGTAVFLNPRGDRPINSSLLRAIITASFSKQGHGPAVFAAVPAFIQQLISTPVEASQSDRSDAATLLGQFQTILLAGSLPSSGVVNWLEEHKLNVLNFISSTETGPLMSSGPSVTDGPPVTSDWLWYQMDVERKDSLVMEPVDVGLEGEESYELVVRPGYPTLCVGNRVDGAFATKDLFTRHPTDPDRWRYLMRKDDVIVHSNAMITNPTYIEEDLAQWPGVNKVLVVGNERLVPIVLIIGSQEIDASDLQARLAEINEAVPAQSRLRPSQLCWLPEGSEFVMSPKGTIIRRMTEDRYRKEIEQALVNCE